MFARLIWCQRVVVKLDKNDWFGCGFKRLTAVIIGAAVLCVAACTSGPSPTPVPTGTAPVATRVPAPTITPVPTFAPTREPTATVLVATPTPSPSPTATKAPVPTAVPSPTATKAPLATPTPTSTTVQTPGYTTRHGSVLPLINTNELEDALLLLINALRSMEEKDSLVRVSALDEFARTSSRLMADSKQLDAEPLELGCGGSGFEVVQWPQVKSFNYRGPTDAPSSTTPTEYEKTAEESASGIVGFMNEDRDSYIGDPHFKYLGVGIVQEPDELGFMNFWVTLHFADCLDEAPAETTTPTAPATPSPTPTVVVAPSPTPTATPRPDPTAVPSPLRAFQNGRWLEQEDPQLASAMSELGWVMDGIKGIEHEALENLLYIAVRSRPVASSIVSFGWVQDGVEPTEVEALGWINNIRDADVAYSVVGLGWVVDGISGIDVKSLEEISYIHVRDSEVASSVVSTGWVEDGINDIEVEALDWLSNIGSAEVASSIVTLGWVDDGIEEIEVKALQQLSYLTNRDEEAAMRIVGMPFVQTIEPSDTSAIESLAQLAAFRPETFVRVKSHPTVRAGISDDWAVIVATLNGVAETNPGLIDILLDSSRVTLERRTITLPQAGDVGLFIIRTGPGATRSMELLEHSVRGAEEFMGAPLPTNFVGVLYEEAVYGAYAGTNFGTHIATLPKFDIDDGSRDAEFAGSNSAHEVAHYYWRGNEDWVDEGAAELMALVIDGARAGQPLAATRPPCAHASSLKELERLEVSRGDVEFGCNYSLGERLFVDLYRTLGRERFQQGFRTLYQVSEIEDDDEKVRGTPVGIEHIREAFRSEEGSENAVISRWYDGTEPYDLSRLDTGRVDPILPSINGRIDEAYVVTAKDGPAVSAFSAQDVSDWVRITLKYSYGVSSGPRSVPLEIVEYYEDGFEFSRRSAELTAETQYIGDTAWFSVGQSPPRKWAPGRYWVYVYAGDQKVAEVSYEVTP